jgi:hypothetical protein
VTGLLGFFDPDLFDRWRSNEARDLLAWSGYEALLEFPTSFWWLWLLILTAVRIGMLSFSPAARAAFALFSVFGFLSFAVTGVQVFTAFSCVVGSVGGFADGAILALAYF